jgi:uncharacterized protein YbjQ (UPF0145 family)
MAAFGDVLFQIAFILILLGLGFGIGRYRERRHFRRLDEQEDEFRDIRVSSVRRLPVDSEAECRGLVSGSVVVATDYFKVFGSAIRNLFGGEVHGFETLVRRARREALIRMLGEAREVGANAVINVRYETSTVGGQQQKKSGGVEVLVYGTALVLRDGTGA